MSYILVFLGGGLGSIARFLVGRYFDSAPGALPISTFLSNTLSSLILGVLMGYYVSKPQANENIRLLIATGFCGGFSTFSTFSYETFMLLNTGNYKTGLLNIFANLLLCYAAIAIGFFAGRGI
ncbi:MAG TPA: fluoride efflux transporter CrcB [Chitinophagales bacterium]|nr:fluoride efflux transporter CrcB [Chitinophagales bacterium]